MTSTAATHPQRESSQRDNPSTTVPTEKSITSDKETMTDNEEDSKMGEINEGGHVQELERNFSLLSICSVGIVTGNCWVAFGGSIVFAIYNGGPPGVLYEFIAVAIFYWLITASLAELASSMPSSAGVYQWASITPGPRWGRVCGYMAGWWNTAAWICGGATMANIAAQILVSMYAACRPGFEPQPWMVFIAYFATTWICCLTVLFGNRLLPRLNTIGLAAIIGGLVGTILICAITPGNTDSRYATSSFVWKDWVNATGWENNRFVFMIGMLNGAFAIGTPDCVAHLAEEIPQPRRNIPLAMAAQMVFGFVSTFAYAIAILYTVKDLEAVTSAPFFPLAKIYTQATNSTVGIVGLCILIFVPIIGGTIGSYITAGRGLWTIARDGAVPFSDHLGTISPRFKNPFVATLVCGVFTTILGGINVGSKTAFGAITGSFVVMTTLSYLAAILPFVLTRRFSRAGQVGGPHINSMRPGWFQMPNVVGYTVNIISCAYIATFVVIFCFPTSYPVTRDTMNYSSVIAGGVTVVAFGYLMFAGAAYVPPSGVTHEEAVEMTAPVAATPATPTIE